MLKPLLSIVMIEPIDVVANTSLVLPDSVKDNIQFRYGYVRGVGTDVKSPIKLGDKVLYVHGKVFEYDQDGSKMLLISEESLVGVVTDGAVFIKRETNLN